MWPITQLSVNLYWILFNLNYSCSVFIWFTNFLNMTISRKGSRLYTVLVKLPISSACIQERIMQIPSLEHLCFHGIPYLSLCHLVFWIISVCLLLFLSAMRHTGASFCYGEGSFCCWACSVQDSQLGEWLEPPTQKKSVPLPCGPDVYMLRFVAVSSLLSPWKSELTFLILTGKKVLTNCIDL